jgi:hypothetical protein
VKRILLVWPYHRKDWIQTFKVLDRDFEFHYLTYIHPEFDKTLVEERPVRVHYWSQFSSAQDLLNTIMPDKVVFMSIDTGLTICLNTVAKESGIPTYILQHGVYTNYKDYRIREKIWNKSRVATKSSIEKQSVNFSTLRFVRNSLSLQQSYSLFRIFVHSIVARKKGIYFANRYLSFSGKMPSYYICFSKANARIHEELDNPKPGQFIFTGSPELDTYLYPPSLRPHNEPFLLHIDQAMAENSFGEETVSRERMIDFYNKLNVLALRLRCRLFIKLHPESYKSEWLPVHENISYLRATPNLPEYIAHAELCTGFYSTLVIPAAYLNRLILFNINYSFIQEVLGVFSNVKVVKFNEFDPATLDLGVLSEARASELESYFFKFDGRSVERIKDALNS